MHHIEEKNWNVMLYFFLQRKNWSNEHQKTHDEIFREVLSNEAVVRSMSFPKLFTKNFACRFMPILPMFFLTRPWTITYRTTLSALLESGSRVPTFWIWASLYLNQIWKRCIFWNLSRFHHCYSRLSNRQILWWTNMQLFGFFQCFFCKFLVSQLYGAITNI